MGVEFEGCTVSSAGRANHAGGRSFARCIGYLPWMRFVTLRDRHGGQTRRRMPTCSSSSQRLGTNHVARATLSSPANAANGKHDHGLRQWRYARAVRVPAAPDRRASLFGYRRLRHRWRGAAVRKRDEPPERARCAFRYGKDSLYDTCDGEASRPTSTFSGDDSTTAYKDMKEAEFAVQTAPASDISTTSDAGRLRLRHKPGVG